MDLWFIYLLHSPQRIEILHLPGRNFSIYVPILHGIQGFIRGFLDLVEIHHDMISQELTLFKLGCTLSHCFEALYERKKVHAYGDLFAQ